MYLVCQVLSRNTFGIPSTLNWKFTHLDYQVLVMLINPFTTKGNLIDFTFIVYRQTVLLVKGKPLGGERVKKLSHNPFTTKGDLIDFTLSNARRFYLSKGNPLVVKGLIMG